MKLAPLALLLLPSVAAVPGEGPVVDGQVCKMEMHTPSKWRCGVDKRIFCAMEGRPSLFAAMTAFGVDEDGNRLFECTVTLTHAKLQTCCKVDEGKRQCDQLNDYKTWEHNGEEVLGLWLSWQADRTYLAISNGPSATKSYEAKFSGDKIVNATVQGRGGIKYCFPWGCQVGADGKKMC